MAGCDTLRSRNRHPRPCSSVPPPPQGPKEAEHPPPENVHSPGRSQVLSSPTPCTHAGQDPVVTQRAGMPGAGKGAGLHRRQTGAAGRAEHTWSVAPALPGCQPAPAGLWDSQTPHTALQQGGHGPFPSSCGSMAGDSTVLSQARGGQAGGCWVALPAGHQGWGHG